MASLFESARSGWWWLRGVLFFFLGCSSAWAQWGREQDGATLEQATRASIVFATHDLSSPVSLFGHSFLVLHQEPIPEPQALVMEFGGMTRSGLDHLRALVSEIEGGFTLSFFSYKEREYFTEGRSLWVYPLLLDDAGLAKLKQRVRASIGQRARYTFPRWNCSHYILDLVASAADIGRTGPEVPFVVPADTLRSLHARGLLGPPVFRASPGSRSQRAYNAMSVAGRAQIRSFWQDPEQASEQPLTKEVEQSLSISADHWMLRETQAGRRDAWYRLKRDYPLAEADTATPADPASGRGSGEWTLGHDVRQHSTSVGWRLGLLSLAGEEATGLRNARLQLLALEIERRNGVSRLARADVLAMEANVPGDLYFAGFTQRLDLGYVDDQPRLDRVSQRFLLQFGRGTTRQLANASVSLLPSVAVGALNGGAGWKPVVSMGLKASAYVPLPGHWRAKFTSEWSGRELAGMRSSHQFEAASPVFRKSTTVSLRVEWRNQRYRDASVGMLWAYRMPS